MQRESAKGSKMKRFLVLLIFVYIVIMGTLLTLAIMGVGEDGSMNESEVSGINRVFDAVCWIESKNNPVAFNGMELARGIAQITPIMIDDVNRILGKETYADADAYEPDKAREMFQIYCLHYYPDGPPEYWARAWNGGPTGPTKPSTLEYWLKVKAELENKK